MSYQVGKFLFETEREAQAAQKEAQAIDYIMHNMDMTNPEAVLAMYKQVLKQELFHTALGIDFLKKVYEELKRYPQLNDKTIPPYPKLLETEAKEINAGQNKEPDGLDATAEKKADKKSRQRKKRTEKTKAKKVRPENRDTEKELKTYRRLVHVLLPLCMMLLLTVIGMFIVNATSNHPTILNYEEKITNRYASWKQELTEREKELDKREQALVEREQKANERTDAQKK